MTSTVPETFNTLQPGEPPTVNQSLEAYLKMKLAILHITASASTLAHSHRTSVRARAHTAVTAFAFPR
jgi:hypothetical protein